MLAVIYCTCVFTNGRSHALKLQYTNKLIFRRIKFSWSKFNLGKIVLTDYTRGSWALIKFRWAGLMFAKVSHRLCHHTVALYIELDLPLCLNQLQTACSVMILSVEATICTTVRSNEAKKLKSLRTPRWPPSSSRPLTWKAP